MFYKFDNEDESRLNRGVRGRLINHCKFLMREKKLKGFDAQSIYENTKQMTYDNTEKERQNEAYTVDLRDQDQDQEEEEK